MFTHGGVGEVVNTLDCGSSTRGFDSHIPPHWDIIELFLWSSFFYAWKKAKVFILLTFAICTIHLSILHKKYVPLYHSIENK